MDAKRPNILIINCDQMQSFALGCYGHPLVKTPSIDRLAEAGVRFVNGISNSPVCMPARSILMSGQYERSCTGGASNVSLPGTIGRSYLMPQYPRRGRQHLKDEEPDYDYRVNLGCVSKEKIEAYLERRAKRLTH